MNIDSFDSPVFHPHLIFSFEIFQLKLRRRKHQWTSDRHQQHPKTAIEWAVCPIVFYDCQLVFRHYRTKKELMIR